MKAFKTLICILIVVFALSAFAACGNKNNNDNTDTGSDTPTTSQPSDTGSTPDEEVEEFTVTVTAPDKSWEVTFEKPTPVFSILLENDITPTQYAIYKDGNIVGPYYSLTEDCELTLKDYSEVELNTDVAVTLNYNGFGNEKNLKIPENCTIDVLFVYLLMGTPSATAYAIDTDDTMSIPFLSGLVLIYDVVFDITVNGNSVNGDYVIKQGDEISIIENKVEYFVTISVNGRKVKYNGYNKPYDFYVILLELGLGENSTTTTNIFDAIYETLYKEFDVTVDGKTVTEGNIIISKECKIELTFKNGENAGGDSDNTTSDSTSEGTSTNPPVSNKIICKYCGNAYEQEYICPDCNLCYDCCGGHVDYPVDPDPEIIKVTIIINNFDGTQSKHVYETSESINLKKALHYTGNDNYTVEEYHYFWMVGYEVVDLNYEITEDTTITYTPTGWGVNVNYYADAEITEDGSVIGENGIPYPVPQMYLKSFITFLGEDFKQLAENGYWMIGNKVVEDPNYVITDGDIFYIHGDPDGEENNNFIVSFMINGTAAYYEIALPMTIRELANAYGIDYSKYDLFIHGEEVNDSYLLTTGVTIYFKEKIDGCKHEKFETFNRVCDTTNCDHNLCLICNVVFARNYDAVGNYNDVICEICTEYVNKGEEDKETVNVYIYVNGKLATELTVPVGMTYKDLVEKSGGNWENYSKDSISTVNGAEIDGDYIFTADTEVFVTPVYDNDEDFIGEEVTEEVWNNALEINVEKFQLYQKIEMNGQAQETKINFEKDVIFVESTAGEQSVSYYLTSEGDEYYRYVLNADGSWAKSEISKEYFEETRIGFLLTDMFKYGELEFDKEQGLYVAESYYIENVRWDVRNVKIGFENGMVVLVSFVRVSEDMSADVYIEYSYEETHLQIPEIKDENQEVKGEEVTEDVWAKAKDMLKGKYQAQYVLDMGVMVQETSVCFDGNLIAVMISQNGSKMLMVYTYEDGTYYMYYPDSEGLWARNTTDENEINEINKTFAVFSFFNFDDFTFEAETGRYYAEKIDASETPYGYIMNVSVYFVDGMLAGLNYSVDMGGMIGKFTSVYTYEDINIEMPVLGEDSGFDVGDNGGNGGGSDEPDYETVICPKCNREVKQGYICPDCGVCIDCCNCHEVEGPTACPHDNCTYTEAKCGSDLQHYVCDDCGLIVQAVKDEVGNNVYSICQICNYGEGGEEEIIYKCKKCGNPYKETDICKECGLCYSCCGGTHGGETEDPYVYTVFFIYEGITSSCSFEKEISIAEAAVICGIDWTKYDIFLNGEQVNDYCVLTSNARVILKLKSSDVEGECQHANCTAFNPVCDMANNEHYYCHDCDIVVYRSYTEDGGVVSAVCDICTKSLSGSEDETKNITITMSPEGQEPIPFSVNIGITYKEFVEKFSGITYEEFSANVISYVDGKEINGDYMFNEDTFVIAKPIYEGGEDVQPDYETVICPKCNKEVEQDYICSNCGACKNCCKCGEVEIPTACPHDNRTAIEKGICGFDNHFVCNDCGLIIQPGFIDEEGNISYLICEKCNYEFGEGKIITFFNIDGKIYYYPVKVGTDLLRALHYVGINNIHEYNFFINGEQVYGDYILSTDCTIYLKTKTEAGGDVEVEIPEGAMSKEEWVKALSLTNYSFATTLVYSDGSEETAYMYVTETAIKSVSPYTEYYILVDGQWIRLYQYGNEGPYYGSVYNNFEGVGDIFIDVAMFADMYSYFKYDAETDTYISTFEEMPISFYFENGVLVEHYITMEEGVATTVISDVDRTIVNDIPEYTLKTDSSDGKDVEAVEEFECKYCGTITTAEKFCFECYYCINCCNGHETEEDVIVKDEIIVETENVVA